MFEIDHHRPNSRTMSWLCLSQATSLPERRVPSATVSLSSHILTTNLDQLTNLKSAICLLAACLLLPIALPQQRRPQRHDDHRLRNKSKPNPEKHCSHVAHLGAQHRVDGTAR